MSAADAPPFTIRRARDDEGPAIVTLAADMFRDPSRYQWLYQHNPHGPALTWLALDASGEPVGVTSLFPRRVLVEGRLRTGSIGGDCYIHPRARRRGLATLLHRASFAGMGAAGVDFMYGPPLPNNLGALLKAGSREVTDFQRYTRPLTGAAALASLRRILPPRLGALVPAPVAWALAVPMAAFGRATRAACADFRLDPYDATADAEWDAAHDEIARGYPIAPVRDAAFLRWRYLEPRAHLQRPYLLRRGRSIVGLMVLELGGEVGVVVDLFVRLEAAVIDAALQLAIDAVSEAGCARIDVPVTPGSPLTERFRARALIGRGGPRFQVAHAADDPQAAVLGAAAAWHFTSGDKDSVTVFSVDPQ